MNTGTSILATVLALFAFTAPGVSAQWTISPYIWATDLGMNVSINGQTVLDETIGFTDLVKDIDMALQLRVEGRRGQLGVMADLFDVRMSTSGDQVFMPNSMSATLDTKIRMTLIDFGGLYNPRGDGMGITLFYGARIISQSANIDAAVQVDSFTVVPAATDQSDTVVDALIGWRYTRVIAGDWMIESQGDVTTGGTKYTWSAGGRIARSFGDRYTLSAGYRKMSIHFEDETPAQVSMNLSGLVVGFEIGL